MPSKRISEYLGYEHYSNMSTNNKQYTPTATARPNWRQREAQKERQQRESAAKAAEDERVKSFANTEENFPSTMKPTNNIRVHGGPSGKFIELANKLQVDEEALRQAKKARRQKIAYDPNLFIRSGGRRLNYEEDDDYESTVVEETTDLNEKYPPHGKRGTYSAPDYEGFRTVTKKTKKVKRELTEAELQKKYREEFFGEGAEEEDAVMNAELAESSQRREFY